VPSRSLENGLRVLEDEAAKVLPPGYRIDYTGDRASFARRAEVFARHGLALVLIFLVLARSSIPSATLRHPGRFSAAGHVGALIFTFLKFQGPPA